MSDALLPAYPWIKALHIIAVIAWMAGMMYLPRIFIYHFQSAPGGEAESFFKTMARRLLKGIMNPSLIAVWLFASMMIAANPALLSTPWFHVKLACVLAITGIHGFYAGAYRQFQNGARPRSERFWRVMNEAPFILMIIVVFLAITKPF